MNCIDLQCEAYAGAINLMEGKDAVPTEWQGRRAIVTRSAITCYCDDDGTEELDVQIEIARKSGNGT
jgi:hypothetical protein